MSVNGADAELLSLWYKELKMTLMEYREPILETDTVEFVKLACDTLRQDSHVFIMTVDILETYIHVKNYHNKKIDDQLLVICAIIFICSKHIGEQSELKTRYIEVLYERVSNSKTTSEKVKQTEIDILHTLNQSLPLYSKIDDLKVFLENYVKPKYLKVDVTDLCVQILNLVYIKYKSLFFDLKNLYNQNNSALNAFKQVVTNRFYLPCGILLCAFQMTSLKNTVDLSCIISEMSKHSCIHKNHLELLYQKIFLLISEKED